MASNVGNEASSVSWLRVRDNVELPIRRLPKARRAGLVDEALAAVGLADAHSAYPWQLSGGMQQRVAIARAVAPGPAVVLADEPTGNLDPGTGAAVFGGLREIQAERGFALVVATHSGRVAHGCDRMLRLIDGRLQPLDAHEAARYFDGDARLG